MSSKTIEDTKLVERLQSLSPVVIALRKRALPIEWMNPDHFGMIESFEELYGGMLIRRNWNALVELGTLAGFDKVDLGRLVAAGIDLRKQCSK